VRIKQPIVNNRSVDLLARLKGRQPIVRAGRSSFAATKKVVSSFDQRDVRIYAKQSEPRGPYQLQARHLSFMRSGGLHSLKQVSCHDIETLNDCHLLAKSADRFFNSHDISTFGGNHSKNSAGAFSRLKGFELMTMARQKQATELCDWLFANPGEPLILQAFSNQGKSTLKMQITEMMIKHGVPVRGYAPLIFGRTLRDNPVDLVKLSTEIRVFVSGALLALGADAVELKQLENHAAPLRYLREWLECHQQPICLVLDEMTGFSYAQDIFADMVNVITGSEWIYPVFVLHTHFRKSVQDFFDKVFTRGRLVTVGPIEKSELAEYVTNLNDALGRFLGRAPTPMQLHLIWGLSGGHLVDINYSLNLVYGYYRLGLIRKSDSVVVLEAMLRHYSEENLRLEGTTSVYSMGCEAPLHSWPPEPRRLMLAISRSVEPMVLDDHAEQEILAPLLKAGYLYRDGNAYSIRGALNKSVIIEFLST